MKTSFIKIADTTTACQNVPFFITNITFFLSSNNMFSFISVSLLCVCLEHHDKSKMADKKMHVCNPVVFAGLD